MLRCVACGSEDKFIVDERMVRRIMVQIIARGNWRVTDTLQQTAQIWDRVRCVACGTAMEDDESRGAYEDARL